MTVKEKIEFDPIDYDILDDKIISRCYQSYTLTKTTIEPSKTDVHDWVSTKHKMDVLQKVNDKVNPKTYMDFGSNLGVLVFQMAQKDVYSIGVDYFQQYVDICNKFKNHLKIENCEFICDTFDYFKTRSNIKPIDVISSFNVHHHLWGRTEQPQTLQNINDTFLKHCNHLLVEFPSQNDKKTKKHMREHPGLGEFSEAEFLKTVGKYKVEKVGQYAKDRPIYLISK